MIEDLSGQLGSWTYLLVGALAFLETGAFVGLVAPGEFTVLLGGAVAGQGEIRLELILAITWFAAWAGDSVSFLLGHRLGRSYLRRHGHRVGVTPSRVGQVEDYFDRHGGKTILIGRFIGLVRALAPFVAGSSGMRYRAFVPYSILGTGVWATALILAGYFASQSLDEVARLVGTGLVAFGFLVGVVVAGAFAVRYLREPGNRVRIVTAMERRRALRPLTATGRRLRPQARFVWARLTPGGLGLELTSLLAALAVALFVLIAYASIVSDEPGPTSGDETALEVARDIETGWLTDVAEVLTTLGSGYVAFPIAGLAGLLLLWKRRWAELAVLVLGGALIVALGDALKDAIGRPRPPDPLRFAEGSAFPSRHAAFATVYAWLAATIVLRLDRVARRAAVIAAGIAITAVVGLTRVYLRIHYLSDVSSGWSLGVACFCAVAAITLVAVHIRHNVAGGRAGDSGG